MFRSLPFARISFFMNADMSAGVTASTIFLPSMAALPHICGLYALCADFVSVLDEKDLWQSLQYHLWWLCSFPFFFILCEWQYGHSSTALIVILRQSKKLITKSFPNIQRPASEGNCCINPESGLWIFSMQHQYSTTLGLFVISKQHYCLSFSKK